MSRTKPFGAIGKVADQAALARLGTLVRQRLDADASVYKVPTERAELYAVGGFLAPEECARLIATIDSVAKPSTVFDPENQSRYRTSHSGDVDPNDSFVQMIERRLGDLTGIDLAWSETVQGQRYHPGQEFRGHHDWFNIAAGYWPKEVRRGGQRSWTAMAYLNDVEEGGETQFPQLEISITPQAGALLVWNNARPDGSPNPDVLHAALPVVRGVKYVVTKWFRTRAWS